MLKNRPTTKSREGAGRGDTNPRKQGRLRAPSQGCAELHVWDQDWAPAESLVFIFANTNSY